MGLDHKNAWFEVRKDELSPILHEKKNLTQQYAVNSYLQLKTNNPNYLLYNQVKLHAEEYSDLLHFVQQGDVNAGSSSWKSSYFTIHISRIAMRHERTLQLYDGNYN